MKKERATVSDEARERTLIAEQIERAKAEADEEGGSDPKSRSPPVEEGLKRDEGEKVVLSLSAKPAAVASPSPSTPIAGPSQTPAVGLKLNPLKANPLRANPLKANPLKRPNPLKMAASSSAQAADNEKSNDRKRPAAAMSAAERLILEDQERKRRRMERESAA